MKSRARIETFQQSVEHILVGTATDEFVDHETYIVLRTRLRRFIAREIERKHVRAYNLEIIDIRKSTVKREKNRFARICITVHWHDKKPYRCLFLM